MFILESYSWAVLFCVVTMLCWGSWANTLKLAGRGWRFELFYWDYALGVLLISLLLGGTLGSSGAAAGRSFAADLGQAGSAALVSALIGGVIFNAANILLVGAIDIAGMAVAFPVGIGLALVLGVVSNYWLSPVGNPWLLFTGVALVTAAVVVDAAAYRRLPAREGAGSGRGLALAVAAGVLMGFFYRFVAAAMSADFRQLEPQKMGPYAAVAVFSAGLVLSNLVFNTAIMKRPFSGVPVPFSDYGKGSFRDHLVGILGGAIWGVGMLSSIVASGQAGFAISYGLGQGATMVAALWGVFVWREFRRAPPGTNRLIGMMFAFFLAGLLLIIFAREV